MAEIQQITVQCTNTACPEHGKHQRVPRGVALTDTVFFDAYSLGGIHCTVCHRRMTQVGLVDPPTR